MGFFIMTSNTKFTELAKYDDELCAVRIAAEGSAAVKHEREKLLPNPATVIYTDGERQKLQQDRYEKYLLNAEFDAYTSQTQGVMLGKLDLQTANIEVPSGLEYLLEDSDGDGLSFANGLLGSGAKNVTEAKWHIVVADYQGLVELDVEDVSIADAEMAKKNARVKFKQYPRESLIQYNVSTVNGVRQVDFLKFREFGYTFNKETGTRESVTSYLTLALDEKGNYYQQKYTEGANGVQSSTSERNEIEGFNFIPFWVFSDEELQCGDFPQELGYLGRIAEVCYQRYRLSADFKEVLAGLLPTTYVGVSDSFSLDAFEIINGRKTFAKGEANVIPGEVSVQTEGVGESLQPFFEKFTETKQTLKDYGAYVPESGDDETATKARINAAQQTAVLLPLAANLIEGTKALFAYAGVFEGLWGADGVEAAKEQITVAINTEFETNSLTGMEFQQYAMAIATLKDMGQYNDELVTKVMLEKGMYPKDMNADDIMKSLASGLEE